MELDLSHLQYTKVMDRLSLEAIMDQYGMDVWNGMDGPRKVRSRMMALL